MPFDDVSKQVNKLICKRKEVKRLFYFWGGKWIMGDSSFGASLMVIISAQDQSGFLPAPK